MKEYLKKVDKDKNILYINQKLCPFHEFKKCMGDDCALYSITGFTNKQNKRIDYGDCSMFKLPSFLIDLRTTITSKGEQSEKR